MVEWFKARWQWLAGVVGSIVLLAAVYLSGRSLRKGDIEIGLAKRELEKANTAYDTASKQAAALHEKQKRLVSDILTEQLARAEELKRSKGLTDAQVLDELRRRGDINE